MARFAYWGIPTVIVLGLAMQMADAQQRVEPRRRADQGKSNQTQAQPRTTLRPVEPNPADAAQNADQQIATWLAQDNEAEIQLSKLAAERAQNKDVKQFAEMMIEEHTKLLDELRRFSGQAGVSPRDELTPAETTEPAAGAQDRPKREAAAARDAAAEAEQPPATNPRQLRMTAFEPLRAVQQINRECLAMAQQELQQREGADFDMAFMGMQIGGHHKMVATCKVLREYSSPDLQKVVDQGEKAAEAHRRQAKQIIETLASAETPRSTDASKSRDTSQSPGQTTTKRGQTNESKSRNQ